MKSFWNINPSRMNAGQWVVLLAVGLGVLYVVPRVLSAATPSKG